MALVGHDAYKCLVPLGVKVVRLMRSRRVVVLSSAAFAITAACLGASHLSFETNGGALVRLRKGMTRDAVVEILGHPNVQGMATTRHFGHCNEVLIYEERRREPLLRWLEERIRPVWGGSRMIVQVCLNQQGRVDDLTWQFVSH
jgi:hypothetical protein